ncbi:MAG: hypothetical protein LC808_19550, partial [Actinobacteria bacterium]|nr:hypothetical protein [Actinomycetota bacterium]
MLCPVIAGVSGYLRLTWSVTVVERETVPLAPSIVSVKVPFLAVVVVEMVSTADDEVGFGSNVAVAPEL